MDNQELVEVYQKIVIGKFGSVSKRHNSNYFYKTGNSAIWDEVMEKQHFFQKHIQFYIGYMGYQLT